MNGFNRDREQVRTFAPMQGARRDPAFPHYPRDQRDRAAHQGGRRAHRGHRPGLGGGLGGRQRRQGGDTGDRARPARERRGAAVDADQLPSRGGRAAAALRVAGRPVRAAADAGDRAGGHAGGVGGLRAGAVDRRADRGASVPGGRRRAGRAEQPRAGQRRAAAVGPGARHRGLGRAGDARDHARPVRRRLAGRSVLLAGGVPAHHPVHPGQPDPALVRPGDLDRARAAVARLGGRPADRGRSRRRDLRADRGPGKRVAERPGPGRRGGRGHLPGRALAGRAAPALPCSSCRCSHRANSTRST